MSLRPSSVSAEVFFQKIFLPYFSYWSYGESLPVMERPEELDNPASLSSAYSRLSTLLAARLDWSAIDASVDLSEVESLRGRLSQRQTDAALAESALNATKEAFSGARRKWLLLTLASVISAVLLTTLGGTFLQFRNAADQLSESQAARTLLLKQLETVSDRAEAAIQRASEEAAQARIEAEMQRSQMAEEITRLTSQNSQLLKTIEAAQQRNERLNLDTQRRLDDAVIELRRQNVLPRRPFP